MRKIWLKYKKETKLCPHCNKEIPKFGIQCPYCYEYIIQRGEFYERKDSKYFPKSQEEYEKMCKDLNKTIFTKGEYEEWKSKQPLFCPNCKSELLNNIHKCDLCNWEPSDTVKRGLCVHILNGNCFPTKNCYDRCTDYKEYKDVQIEEKQSRRIPQHVKNEVWRRDKGRCAECGSRIKLEYDHIIPFSKGGSNTVRNIELLCEKCNRKKSNTI